MASIVKENAQKRQETHKKGLTAAEGRRRREEAQVSTRKQKRNESVDQRRKGNDLGDWKPFKQLTINPTFIEDMKSLYGQEQQQKKIYDKVKNYFYDGLSRNFLNFQNLQHGLFDIINPILSGLSKPTPFNFAVDKGLFLKNPTFSPSPPNRQLLTHWPPPTHKTTQSWQEQIFSQFHTIVGNVITNNPPHTNDKIVSEIQLLSAIAAKTAVPSSNIKLSDFNNNVDLGAVGLFSSLDIIVPRNAKGQTQARSVLENPGSSWANGQCEHAYAAYGLQIHFIQDEDDYHGRGTFHWGKLGDTTRLAPVCCYMCRKPLTRGKGEYDMECEHKKPFMRGITDWSLLIKSLFIDEYKNLKKGAWKNEEFLEQLPVDAYIWLLLSSLEYAPSCKSCNQKTGKSNIPLENVEEILQKFTEQSTRPNNTRGSNEQYKPAKGTGFYHSGIINERNFFKDKAEITIERKLIKFLFALSDESVLKSIIGLYRRGKSVNPMQKVLDELKIVSKILSREVGTINEAIEIRKQKVTDALNRAKVIEENLIQKLENINSGGVQVNSRESNPRRDARMKKAKDDALKLLEDEKKSVKQDIIDSLKTREYLLKQQGLMKSETRTRFFSDLINTLKQPMVKTLDTWKTFNKSLYGFEQGKTPTIQKIFTFFGNAYALTNGSNSTTNHEGGGNNDDAEVWANKINENIHEVFQTEEMFDNAKRSDEFKEYKNKFPEDSPGRFLLRHDTDGISVFHDHLDLFVNGTNEIIGNELLELIYLDNKGGVHDYYITEICKELGVVGVKLTPVLSEEEKGDSNTNNAPNDFQNLNTIFMENIRNLINAEEIRLINLDDRELSLHMVKFYDYFKYFLHEIQEPLNIDEPKEEKGHTVKQVNKKGATMSTMSSRPTMLPHVHQTHMSPMPHDYRGGKKHTKKIRKRKKHTKKNHKRKKHKRKKHKKKLRKRKKHTKKHHKRKKHTRYKKKNTKQKTKRKKYTRYKN